jgi:hypothetical protein
MVRYLVVAVVLSLPVLSFAQSPVAETSKFKPSGPPPGQVGLQNLMVAKAVADKSSMMLLVPQYKYETRTRTYTVTKVVPETRTRPVKLKDGSIAEQTYTVEVPVTEERTQEYMVGIVMEPSKVYVPLKEVRAWQISGETVDTGELLRRLGEATHVFAMEIDASAKFEPVEPFFSEVLRPRTLVLYLSPGVLSGAEGAKAVSPAPAPAPVPAPAPPAKAPNS